MHVIDSISVMLEVPLPSIETAFYTLIIQRINGGLYKSVRKSTF